MGNAEQPIKHKSMLKRIWNWISFRVKSRKWLIEELTKANKVLRSGLELFTITLKELDQSKMYYLKVDSVEDVEVAKKMLKMAELKMKWTLPKILVTTKEFGEVKEE